MNNKGSFKDEESVGKRFKGFFKESGFYIAIVVGLCALAAGAVYFSTNQILTDPDENQAQEEGIDQNENNNLGMLDIDEPDFAEPDQSSIDSNGTEFAEEGPYADAGDGLASGTGEEAAGEGETAMQPNKEVAQNDTQAGNDAASADTASTDNEQAQSASGNTDASIADNEATQDVVLAVVRPAFSVPVSGKIQAEYSMDKLVFSPTFNEWRTHSGVDVAAPRGEVVRSVGNGTILEMKNDPRFGFTIVIDHKNGYKSLYANLATDQTMKVGQEVKQGDPIGSVGATAIFESAEPTHLHFELYKENKLVDPASYIDIPK